MKKTLLFLLCALPVAAMSQEPFFAAKQGTVLEYATKNGKGKIQGYTKQTIKEIQWNDEKNAVITYLIEAMDAKKKAITEESTEITVKIVNGNVEFDGSSALGKIMKDIKIEGSGLELPSNLAVGQTLKDYTIKIEAMQMTFNCTDIKVTAKESLTVGGEVLECYKVESKQNSKVMFINTSGSNITWYARGIGVVRSESYDKKGRLVAGEELVSVSR